MDLKKLKQNWNYTLQRYKNAEKLAKEDPDKFIKFIDLFNKIVVELSKMIKEYEAITGEKIPEEVVEKGWDI